MCLTCVILPAQAEIVESGTCGNNLTWTLTDDGTLTINGTGEMNNYNFNSPWPSSLDDNIKTAVIEQDVTSIGDYAFSDCSGLTQMAVLAITPPTVNIDAFDGVNHDIPVYVPEDSLTAYRNADVWKEFNLQALSSTGLHASVLPESIRVYDGLLHNPQELSVRLYDMQGNLVYSGKATVLSMPAGVYLLQCGKASGKVTFY